MHPLVRAAVAAAVLTALGSLDRGPKPLPALVAAPVGARGVDGLPALCPPGTLPEGAVCVRVPVGVDGADEEPAPLRSAARARAGTPGAKIPRQPDRPADPALYLYPVGGAERAPRVLRGFGAEGDEVGITLAARPGEVVTVATLDQQEGLAELVFAGDRDGPTIATSHLVKEGGQLRGYLVIYGKLDHFEEGLAVGQSLEPGATLGYAEVHRVKDGIGQISLEARQVREGQAASGLDAKKLGDPALAIPVDLRNLLPLR